MKRKILGVFVTVMFGCMVLSGCKKNVGTPEDNAVVENEDEQAQDTETSEGHTFGYIITKADLLYPRFLDQGDLSPLQNNLCRFFCSG